MRQANFLITTGIRLYVLPEEDPHRCREDTWENPIDQDPLDDLPDGEAGKPEFAP